MNKTFIIFVTILFVAIISGTIVVSRIYEQKEPIAVPPTAPTPTPTSSPEVTPGTESSILMPTDSSLTPMKKPAVSIKRGDDDGEEREDD